MYASFVVSPLSFQGMRDETSIVAGTFNINKRLTGKTPDVDGAFVKLLGDMAACLPTVKDAKSAEAYFRSVLSRALSIYRAIQLAIRRIHAPLKKKKVLVFFLKIDNDEIVNNFDLYVGKIAAAHRMNPKVCPPPLSLFLPFSRVSRWGPMGSGRTGNGFCNASSMPLDDVRRNGAIWGTLIFSIFFR